MGENISKLLDRVSDYLSQRKGLLPILGMLLVILNLVLNIFMDNWLTNTNLFLHLGIVITIMGFLLAWAL